MAIDVLAREGQCPLVIGDEGDMGKVIGLSIEDGTGTPSLLAQRQNGETYAVKLSEKSAAAFAGQTEAIFVVIGTANDITQAYTVPVGAAQIEERMLDVEELKKISLELISKDFSVDQLG